MMREDYLSVTVNATEAHTMDVGKCLKALLVSILLLSGVRSMKKDAVFIYGHIGGIIHLPCNNLVYPNCSSTSWDFLNREQRIHEVKMGEVMKESDRCSRMLLTSNCSLRLQDLRAEDAGTYTCLQQPTGESTHGNSHIYLSLLTISSPSLITNLKPGGKLILNCILFTYYDSGSCKSYSANVFNLSWVAEERADISKNTRYVVIGHSHCNITLVTNLQSDDHNRKWRCQLKTYEDNSVAVFLDFTSTFVLQSPSTDLTLIPLNTSCSFQLLITRIMLCVSLPIMLIIVNLSMQRGDRKRAKVSAADIEVREID
ncbi:uncharacterized protein LOC142994929 [Genypterus blacodes]|uniref:uncharacterized protein LOC142994929 n=1 Tax=Genypterus blacodes TaxID=154954 RepID=UPI003F75DCC6